MSETKFTPGPWILRTNKDWTISPTSTGDSFMGNATYYPWVPEKIEDWYLIAAAPDLYEALEELMYARTDKAERMAIAALAKAKKDN